jgi:flavin reductase (DIM6/NTAB) family NADH-FMN oxidoreductase RutF
MNLTSGMEHRIVSVQAADVAGTTAEHFLRAMRGVANTVTILSAKDESGVAGMVATAVSSVSVEPPTMLTCVNKRASLHRKIQSGRQFCVNILAAADEEIMSAFVRLPKNEERFLCGAWGDHNGIPYLTTAQANVFCKVVHAVDHATHTVFLGLVQMVLTSDVVSPLVYLDGRTRALQPTCP